MANLRMSVGQRAVIYERGRRHEGVIVKAEIRGEVEWYWVKDDKGVVDASYKTADLDDDCVYSMEEAKKFGV